MHLDMANCTISTMRPFIRQQACEYEREKFDKLLEVQRRQFAVAFLTKKIEKKLFFGFYFCFYFIEAGIDGLAATKAWLRGAFEVLQSDASLGPCTPNNILLEAYLTLLTWDLTKEFPEVSFADLKAKWRLSYFFFVLDSCGGCETIPRALGLPHAHRGAGHSGVGGVQHRRHGLSQFGFARALAYSRRLAPCQPQGRRLPRRPRDPRRRPRLVGPFLTQKSNF